MGMIVNVLRSASYGDCTNNGVSAQFDQLCLVNVDGPFDPSDTAGAAMLVKGNVDGIVVIKPAFEEDDGSYHVTNQWVMMGGNYAATSDSRFSQAVERILGDRFYGAVAIHDRVE